MHSRRIAGVNASLFFFFWFIVLLERPRRIWRVILDGIAAGIAAGIVVAAPFVLKGSSERSMTMQPVAYAIWFALPGFVGALNSTGIYFLNTLVFRIVDPKK